jgi:hypothetical protein
MIGTPILEKYHPEMDQAKQKSGVGVHIEELVRHIKETHTGNYHYDPVS